jgi:hypothetical protein
MKAKMVRLSLIGALLAWHWFLFPDPSSAQITNTWQALGGGKWESGANWDHGVPSINFAQHRLTTVAALNSVAIIDSATVLSHVMNGCLTISNLTIQGGGRPIFPTSTLLLSNANYTPGNIGLTILKSLNINAGGSVAITNSRLYLNSLPASSTNGLIVNGSFLLNCYREQ